VWGDKRGKEMKRVICLVLIFLICLVALCSCGNKITEGEVYEKEYREAFTTVMVLPLVIYNGKSTTTIMVPYVVHYPDRYVIHIKYFQGEEWVTEDFYVSKDVYDDINVGDMFEYDEERGDLQDEPYTKERQE
jgi:hypothetical protein